MWGTILSFMWKMMVEHNYKLLWVLLLKRICMLSVSSSQECVFDLFRIRSDESHGCYYYCGLFNGLLQSSHMSWKYLLENITLVAQRRTPLIKFNEMASLLFRYLLYATKRLVDKDIRIIRRSRSCLVACYTSTTSFHKMIQGSCHFLFLVIQDFGAHAVSQDSWFTLKGLQDGLRDFANV